MTVSVHKLIAAINPDLYCDLEAREEVKKIVKTKGYLEAAKVAIPLENGPIDFEKIQEDESVWKKIALANPKESHIIHYEAEGNSLEPIYFWIHDNIMRTWKKTYKLVDNYVASPGSSQFSEMGSKATRMHDEATKMLGAVNQVIKTILNIIYDLKEFKLRLDVYEDYDSKDKRKREAALLSLKQIWMDSVDIKRGNSALKVMAQQFDFVTLIDSFMVVDSEKSVDNLDLNDRVKRILKQRVSEFFRWIKESDRELHKRYEIEKNYLRSQVNSVKMYSRWLKPYLKAAKALEQTASPTSSLVTAFNTVLFELVIMGQLKFKLDQQVDEKILPKFFRNPGNRKYFGICLVNLNFRSIPERISQQGGYGFSGKVEAEFTSYALSEEEIEVLLEEIEKDDFGDMYRAIEGATDDSLGQMQTDIDDLLEEDTKKKEEKVEDPNPFFSLFSFVKGIKKKGKKGKLPIPLKKDNDVEAVIRSQMVVVSRRKCNKLYQGYKSAHGLYKF